MASPAPSVRARVLLQGAALCALVLAAYLPALRAGFIWDDDTYLTQNSLIRAGDGLYRFWFTSQAADYWPVTTTSLWLEWRLWGMHAAGYHATNIALHAAEVLLLWAVLRRLRIPGAFLGALLFAVHPINVESVAWITQRKNVMAMAFFLLTILFFLNAEDAAERRKAWPWRTASLGAFMLGMLSKGSIATLPLVLGGIVAWRRRPTRDDWIRLFPFLAVAALFTLVDVWFQRHGSGEVIRQAGPLDRLLGAGTIVWFYLCKILLPVRLSFIYPQWHVDAGDPRWWIGPAAAAGVTILLWRSRRGWGRAPLFAWGYLWAALVPVLGFTDTYFMKFSLVADHYAHLAVIGVAAAAGALWSRWRPAGGGRARAPVLAAAAVVATLVVLTRAQCGEYRDLETLYNTTLRLNPDCWLAESNLALVLSDEGRIPEALAHGERALALKPDLPEGHYNLGRALARAGRLPEAMAQYREALRLRPNYPDARYNLGNALRLSGRIDEAIGEYGAAIRLKPDFADARTNLASLLEAAGRGAEAIGQFEEAVRLNPSDPEVLNDLGCALAESGRLDDAIRSFGEALRLRPDFAEAHNNLGMALADAGRATEAAGQFQEAVRLKPGYAEAHRNLGIVLERLGRAGEAAAEAQTAQRLGLK